MMILWGPNYMVAAEKQRSQSRWFSLFGAIPPSSVNTVHIISGPWHAMWLIFHSIMISVFHHSHIVDFLRNK